MQVPLRWKVLSAVIVLAAATTLFTAHFRLHFINTVHKSANHEATHVQNTVPPCGNVCKYDLSGGSSPGKLWPRLQKRFNCEAIMERMAWRHHNITYPPPKAPPADRLDEFEQYGECKLGKNYYFSIDFKPNNTEPRLVSLVDMKKLMSDGKNGQNINRYPDGGVFQKMIVDYREWISGKHGFVVGTKKPWLEAMLLNSNASHVTTLEYNKLKVDHPQVDVIDPYSFAEMYLQGTTQQFDFGATFSSMEHSGLGRYGDPLNPYGDLEAMAQAWCMTKPGGLFLLGLPGNFQPKSRCEIQFNAHRIYGPARLMHMTSNWDVLEARHCNDKLSHFVLALQKP